MYIQDNPTGCFTVTSAHKASLYLFSGSQALLFLSKECPCACPSNLESNGGGQSEADGGSLLKKEYRIEWGNERLGVGNDNRKGDARSQVIIHYLEIHLPPSLSVFLCSRPHPLFVSNGYEKAIVEFSDISAKKINICVFLSPNTIVALVSRIKYSTTLYACIFKAFIFSVGGKWTGPSRESVTGESQKSRVTNEVQVCG